MRDAGSKRQGDGVNAALLAGINCAGEHPPRVPEAETGSDAVGRGTGAEMPPRAVAITAGRVADFCEDVRSDVTPQLPAECEWISAVRCVGPRGSWVGA